MSLELTFDADCTEWYPQYNSPSLGMFDDIIFDIHIMSTVCTFRAVYR